MSDCPLIIPAPWHLQVGVGIAILGFLGIILPLIRDKIGPREKAFWTAAFALLLWLEIRSIRIEEAQHDREQEFARCEDRKRFSEIAHGIDTSIQKSEDQFKETIAGVGKVFDKTEEAARTATEAVNTITGGAGWAYITLDTTLVYGRVTDTLQAELHVMDSKVLRNLQLNVVDYKAFQADRTPIDPRTIIDRDAVNTPLGDVHGLVQLFRPIGIDTRRRELDYFINFFAINGTWREELHYRRKGDNLQHAYRVVWEDYPPDGNAMGMKERVIREDISDDYPKANGQVIWEQPLKR